MHLFPAIPWRGAVIGLAAVTLSGAPRPRRPAPHPPQRLVAEAPIWGANNGVEGTSFLPVTIQGHRATVVIDLQCTRCDLALSPVALARLGVTLPGTTLATLGIGRDVQHQVPVHVIQATDWSVPGPAGVPEVVGVVGVHFLTTHYDILYDFPARRVQLYAFPARGAGHAWLPPGIRTSDCGTLIPVPPGAATFTGMALTLDGHPVTGVIEMAPYGGDEKMNPDAFAVLGLPPHSPRIEPLRQPYPMFGRMITDRVKDVHLMIGRHTFWTGPVKIFPELVVESVLPPKTPIVLLNLGTIRQVVLYHSTSAQHVCISTP